MKTNKTKECKLAHARNMEVLESLTNDAKSRNKRLTQSLEAIDNIIKNLGGKDE